MSDHHMEETSPVDNAPAVPSTSSAPISTATASSAQPSEQGRDMMLPAIKKLGQTLALTNKMHDDYLGPIDVQTMGNCMTVNGKEWTFALGYTMANMMNEEEALKLINAMTEVAKQDVNSDSQPMNVRSRQEIKKCGVCHRFGHATNEHRYRNVQRQPFKKQEPSMGECFLRMVMKSIK